MNIFNSIIRGYAFKYVEEKIVDTLSRNKQFQNMSLQFRDKMEEFTGERPSRPKNINNKQHKHRPNENINKKTTTSYKPNYSNDLLENERIYKEQQRMQRQQQHQYQQENQPKSFFSHLVDSIKEEVDNESKKFKK
ncbi:hypothetical protein CYY_008200 [Polysphondylium violaceum]|uniref:Uncharacterized protein n=1 Tax=Polysphondylium violaceum TaxID=133409 RepID=A0A8J4PNR0_9MYCE|nr:hypothetical protein CYY_008200 [Polysphondylium violaceum]